MEGKLQLTTAYGSYRNPGHWKRIFFHEDYRVLNSGKHRLCTPENERYIEDWGGKVWATGLDTELVVQTTSEEIILKSPVLFNRWSIDNIKSHMSAEDRRRISEISLYKSRVTEISVNKLKITSEQMIGPLISVGRVPDEKKKKCVEDGYIHPNPDDLKSGYIARVNIRKSSMSRSMTHYLSEIESQSEIICEVDNIMDGIISIITHKKVFPQK